MSEFVALMLALSRTFAWLNIVLAPLVVSIVLALCLSYFYYGEFSKNLIYAFGAIGLIVGINWAEHVRKGIGLEKFFSFLPKGGYGPGTENEKYRNRRKKN